MPTFSFGYIKEKGISRPKIPFLVNANGVETETAGLIDSGSDFILIPKDIADTMGIELSGSIEEADGIGGKIHLRIGIVTIIIKKRGKKILRNVKIHIPIDEKIQSDENEKFDEILLGRDPFFKYFLKVEFNENKKRVRLIPNRRTP